MFVVGEECVFDMDCQFDGGYCDGNICAPKDKGNQKASFSFTGKFREMRPSLCQALHTYCTRRNFLLFCSLIILIKNLELLKQS
jgi:hypothetical protein